MQMQEKFHDVRGRKLFIAIPAYDGKVSVTTCFGIAQLALELPKYGVEFTMAHLSGCSVVSKARNTLVHEFRKSGFTDLMFIDSDIQFDPSDILKLIAFAGTHPIVGGVIPTRRPNAPYIATILEDDKGAFTFKDGLVEAKHLGTAFMLIRSDVIETLVKAHPEWAYKTVDGETHYSIFDFLSTPDAYIGEDYNFCDRARAAGFRIFIDPEIKLTHFGVYPYKGDFGKDVIYPALVAEEKAA